MNNFKDFLKAYSLSKICKIVLEYTLKCSQLISSSDNKKILLTIRNVRLDSGRYATKYYSNTAGWFSWDLIKLTPFGLSFVLQFFLGAILRSNNGTPQIIAKIAILCKSILQRSCFLMPPLKSRVESQYLFYVLNMFNSYSSKIDLSNQKRLEIKLET